MTGSAPPPPPPRESDADLLVHKLRRIQVWIWSLVALLLLSGIAYWIRSALDRVLTRSVAEQLTTVRDANVEALQIWLKNQKNSCQLAAESRRVQLAAVNVLESFRTLPPGALLADASREQLQSSLEPWLTNGGFEGFVLLDRDWNMVAASFPELLGRQAPLEYGEFLDPVFAGSAVVSRPFPSLMRQPIPQGQLLNGLPTMYACAPLKRDGEILGALALRIRPDLDFTRILQVGRLGASGETYAFDSAGLLISDGRFDQQLRSYGLLPDTTDSRSILTLTIRDPGVDLTRGERPRLPRDQLPLTSAVQRAIDTREPGVDVQGYRDYFGIPSVGAWTWLEEYRFGVITEVNRDEAYAPAVVIRRFVWGLGSLLLLALTAILGVTWLLARWRKTARQAVLVAQQLGQYTLEEQIGSGGMGTVYRAHHAMLRRPTAVKLLDPAKTNEASLKRFEREVRLTSQLNHPNTVAIYDYGRTPEGLFYYAMELLDGLTLHDLVQQDGPQPAGRVICLLRQICGSLAEAHAMGLIHRDIKPANVLVNQRGGMSDVIKVVDFGLVKDRFGDEARITRANAITGTPLYMAPESIDPQQEVDHRVDLYAVGGVGYYLVCGRELFEAENLFQLLQLQSTTLPDPPSLRSGLAIPSDLERIIMKCLAKSPQDRPGSADELDRLLAACADASSWTPERARDWWRQHLRQKASQSSAPTPTSPGAPTVVLRRALPVSQT
ncbi:MAG: serine/threonine protein kinase [Planctomycetaceae bacterium]